MTQCALLGIPSSGSDWFASCIKKVNPQLKEHPVAKEFFNPICNQEMATQLGSAFGCEMAGTIDSIVVNDESVLTRVYNKTWQAHGELNFTKEVFSQFKARWFEKFFTCIYLVREASLTFPPSRLRVWCWYEAIYHSLLRRFGYPEPIGEFADFRVRCVFAHYISLRYLVGSAPCGKVLDWKTLMLFPEDSLAALFSENLPQELNPEKLASEVVASRSDLKMSFQDRRDQYRNLGLHNYEGAFGKFYGDYRKQEKSEP